VYRDGGVDLINEHPHPEGCLTRLRPVNTGPSCEMLAHLIDAQCVAILLEAWRRLQTATGIGHAVDILTSAA
jgi:hypothetical protein